MKRTRVALLAPALAAVALAYPADGSTMRGLIGMRWLVLGFQILCGIHSLIAIPEPALVWAKPAATALLLLAVTTGIRSPMSLLLEQGWRTSIPVIAATLVSSGLALATALMQISKNRSFQGALVVFFSGFSRVKLMLPTR